MNAAQKRQASEALAERLAKYGAKILGWTCQFPTTKEGRHVQDQLMRSGTAPGAHYGEARGAQSRKDFIHKVSLALKEIRESNHWLSVAYHAGYIDDPDVHLTLGEGNELAAILTASLSTARRRGES